MTAPLNGNLRLGLASQAEEELRRLKRERGDLVTKLRKNANEIAAYELLIAVAGVETIDMGSED